MRLDKLRKETESLVKQRIDNLKAQRRADFQEFVICLVVAIALMLTMLSAIYLVDL
jgi:hypothetical protein